MDPQFPDDDAMWTRRDLLAAGLALGVSPLLGGTDWKAIAKEKKETMETLAAPKLVEVPQAIPEKVYSSERVGISRKTHDEHLKLWQGYANKTNEI